MEEGKGVAMAILGIVAVIAVVGLVLLFSGASGKIISGKPTIIYSPATWSPCTDGETQCVGYSAGAHFIRCTRGQWKMLQYCSANTQCDTNQGCVPNNQ